MNARAIVLAIGGMVIAAQPAQGQFPSRPPAPLALAPAKFPPFQQATLANGLTLVVVENHALPVVSVRLAMQAGERYDPAGKEGLADLTADLLTKGTTTRSADQIAAEIEGVGSSLGADAGADFMNLGSTVLTDHVGIAFTLIGDVVRHSTYPADEVALSRTRALSSVRLEASQPAAIAAREFDAAVYGNHPYGRHPTEASVGGLDQAAVKAFVAARLRPAGSLLVVSGDITLAKARQLAQQALGGWTGAAPAATPTPAPAKARATGIILVHRPGSVQSDIIVGNLTSRPGDPDWYALTVLNKVLGGGTDSRLFQIIREQKSWTYDAHSSVSREKDVGTFSAGTETRTAVTDSALVETLKQLTRLRSEPVPDSELTAAKGFLTGVFPLSIETPQQVASQIATVRLLGLPANYLATYRTRIQAVTAVDVRRAARRFVRADSAVIVVVGDGAALYDKLKAIAPVTIVDPDGKPLTPDDLHPKAAAVPWDTTQLVARSDSFGVIFQGQDVGYWTRVVTTAGDSLVVQQTIAIAAAGASVHETLALSRAGLKARHVDQTSTSPRGTSEVHLAWTADGHVKGNVSNVPQPGNTVRTAAVDTSLGPTVIEGGTLGALIEALPLTDGATFVVAAYNTASGRVDNITVKVSDGGSVTVPAGTFDTWKLDTTGGDASTTYYVAKSPRRLVRRAIVGAPFTFDLLK